MTVRLARLLVTIVAIVGLHAATAATASATTPPPSEAASTEEPAAPPPTEAPSQPAPGPVATTPDAGDADDGGTDWIPIVLIALGVLALVLIIGMILGQGSRRSTPPAPRSPQPSQQANLLSTAQWIHDQLTLELAAADPASARQRWASERSRLDNVAIGAQQQWQHGDGEVWQTLSQTVSALGAAVDTNINLRNQTPPDASLIVESTDVVNRHRAALQQLITAMWPTVHR